MVKNIVLEEWGDQLRADGALGLLLGCSNGPGGGPWAAGSLSCSRGFAFGRGIVDEGSGEG